MKSVEHSDELIKIVYQNQNVRTILESMRYIELPECPIGAGGLAQTVWNYYPTYDLKFYIKDYDLVYFDSDVLGNW